MQESASSVADATDKPALKNRLKTRLHLCTERLSLTDGHDKRRETRILKEEPGGIPSENIKL